MPKSASTPQNTSALPRASTAPVLTTNDQRLTTAVQPSTIPSTTSASTTPTASNSSPNSPIPRILRRPYLRRSALVPLQRRHHLPRRQNGLCPQRRLGQIKKPRRQPRIQPRLARRLPALPDK